MKPKRRRRPAWLKPPQLSPRLISLARLIDRMQQRTGGSRPTDAELASVLAVSLTKIRKYREQIGR